MNHAPRFIEAEPYKQIYQGGASCLNEQCQKSQSELIAQIRQLDEMIFQLQLLICDLLTKNEALRHTMSCAYFDTYS